MRLTYWLKATLLVIAVGVIVSEVLQFLERIGGVVLLIVVATFVAYVLYPLVHRLNRKMSLLSSVLLVYGVLAAIVVLVVYFLIPPLAVQVGIALQEYPAWLKHAQQTLQDPSAPVLGRTPVWIRHYLVNLPQTVTTWIHTHGYDAAMQAIDLLMGTVAAVATIVVVPILSAYLLLDSENIKRYSLALVPAREREFVQDLLSDLEQVVGGFVRGQLLVGTTVGILISALLMVMGVPYGLLIGVAAGVLDMIPYVGAVATAIPAVALAWASHGPAAAGIVLVTFSAIFWFEGHVIAPSIVNKTLALSPLTVLLSFLVMGELLGIVGLFLAVPVAGVARVMIAHFVPEKLSVAEAQPGLTERPREETPGTEEAHENGVEAASS